ncbi:MAG TPA: tRNA (adenosine(37)-N6)-dimethylallyltransferase MiaA [Anaerolineales bacterium]
MIEAGAPILTDVRPIVVILVGPTAVGKTEVSLQLAERLSAEVVSLDSRLFYRGMDIGTAKPGAQERSRIPHHLIDIAEPGETVSLAVFQGLAERAIAQIIDRGRLPLLVGGTGQYVRAVAAGWTPPQVAPNSILRGELNRLAEERGAAWLHSGLAILDARAAALIDARNLRRTVRAMEVVLTTGRPFSRQRGDGQGRFQLISVGLRRPRPDLYARVDARIEEMWRAGILDETRRLMARGFDQHLPAMSAIGYSQCLRVIRGELDPEGAKADMRRLTRAFIRRQANWFKESDRSITWFDAGNPDTIESITAFVQQSLATLRARA